MSHVSFVVVCNKGDTERTETQMDGGGRQGTSSNTH